jgi:hypothetical protein
MDGAKAQAQAYKGYAQVAKRLGNAFTLYRPISPDMTVAQIVATNFLASLNAEDMTYRRPNKYGKPTWFAVMDGSQTQVGDYLIGDTGEYFVAAQQPLLPILVVECNRTLIITRPQTQTQFGAVSDYEGTTAENETILMAGWPASVLQGTKGEKGGVALPGDVRDAWWAILLPLVPGVVLRSGDLIADELGRRYIISSAELSDLGWRLTAQQGQT